MKYRDLVAEAARPGDARFDAVLAELRQVRPEARDFATAKRLIDAIEGARGQQVRTPLALGANGRRPPDLEAQLAACARLAELAGRDGGVDRPALEALELCRKKSELMELEYAHGHEDGGAHP